MAAVATGALIAELERSVAAWLGNTDRVFRRVAGPLSVTDFTEAPIAEAG